MGRRTLGRRDAMGVPAAAPFNPIQLGPFAWFRGGIDLIDTAGDVTYWGDQSGNGYHLEQPNVFWRPTIAYADGKRCVQGGGVSFLENLSFNISGHPITTAAVYNTSYSLGVTQVMTCGTGYTESFQGYSYDGVNESIIGYSSPSVLAGTPFVPHPTPRVGFVEQNGASSSLYDGVTQIATGALPSVGMSRLIVGNVGSQDAPFGGIMMEIIIFDKVLTSLDRQNIYDYLASQWTVA